VINGGFETCDLTGWSLTGNTGSTGINLPGSGSPHSGSCYMAFGAEGSDSVFMQSAQIVTTPGALYRLSFWVQNLAGFTNDFSASWDNGPPLVSFVNTGPFGYRKYTFRVIGTGSDNITFHVRNDPDYFDLDDVSVEPKIPAPTLSHVSVAGLAVLLLGGGIWLTRKRTRLLS
jgi:hypothetical protein